MLDPKLLRQAWEQGSTPEAHLESMHKYQKRMRERMASVQLDKDVRGGLNRRTDVRYVLVVTEDWCGDAIFILPIVARLVEAADEVELRVALRHGHGDLQAQLAERAIDKVPVVIFMGANFQELAVWEEHPEAHRRQFEKWKRANPRFNEIKADSSLTESEREQKLRPLYGRLLSDMYDWYDGELDFQGAAVEEMLAALDIERAGEPASGA